MKYMKNYNCRSSKRAANFSHGIDEKYGKPSEWIKNSYYAIHNGMKGMTKQGYIVYPFHDENDHLIIGKYQKPILVEESDINFDHYTKVYEVSFDELEGDGTQWKNGFINEWQNIFKIPVCNCAGDCCGCSFGGVKKVEWIDDMKFRIYLEYFRNY